MTTIQTYSTKSFKHEGVTGSEGNIRLNEKVEAITNEPNVNVINNSPVEHIVHDGNVKVDISLPKPNNSVTTVKIKTD